MCAFRGVRFVLAGGLVLSVGVGCGWGQPQGQVQDPRALEMVRVATQTELAASRNDHSRWQYKDMDRKPEGEAVYRVVETGQGSVKKKLEADGRVLSPEELREEDDKIEAFVRNEALQAKQRRDGEQDDRRAEDMLKMMPEAFLWSVKSETPETVVMGFVPDPAFHPPTMEARVFAAMEGEIVVDRRQDRIRTIKGKLTQDVKFGYGLFGRMKQGGTFDVERRELAPKVWQITESHVHIDGKALLFRTIGEEDDEVKSEFRRVPPEFTLEQAAEKLKGEPAALNARR